MGRTRKGSGSGAEVLAGPSSEDAAAPGIRVAGPDDVFFSRSSGLPERLAVPMSALERLESSVRGREAEDALRHGSAGKPGLRLGRRGLWWIPQ